MGTSRSHARVAKRAPSVAVSSPLPGALRFRAEAAPGGEAWCVQPLAAGAALASPLGATLQVASVAKADSSQPASAPVLRHGLLTDTLREFFLPPGIVPGAAGVLQLRRNDPEPGQAPTWTAKLAKTPLPAVLSQDSVEAGLMPPHGHSGLPESLEVAVPRRYRYWEAPTPEAARAVRDALVGTGQFDPDLVKLVDGEPRLCVRRLFLYEPEPDVDEPTPALALDDALPRLLGPLASGPLVQPMADPDDGDDWQELATKALADPSVLTLLSPPDAGTTAQLVDTVLKAERRGAWLLEEDDTPDNRRLLSQLGPVFKLAAVGAESRVFVASFLPADMTVVEWPAVATAGAHVPPPSTGAGLHMRSLTVKAEEERFVLGIVLEPEQVDAQQDIYSAAEIRQAAHTYMEKSRTIGLMHKGTINDKVKILESYIAPASFDLNGVPVRAGTWLMGVRVLDDDLWAAVKSGDMTGFSIGGSAVRKPDPTAAPTR